LVRENVECNLHKCIPAKASTPRQKLTELFELNAEKETLARLMLSFFKMHKIKTFIKIKAKRKKDYAEFIEKIQTMAAFQMNGKVNATMVHNYAMELQFDDYGIGKKIDELLKDAAGSLNGCPCECREEVIDGLIPKIDKEVAAIEYAELFFTYDDVQPEIFFDKEEGFCIEENCIYKEINI
jgi:hypothetical protein